MSVTTGEKALKGEWERISAFVFEIAQDMTIEFEGMSCNVLDSEGTVVETLGENDESVKRKVYAGYRCYVMKAWVRFEKDSV